MDSPVAPISQGFSKGPVWVADLTSPTGEGGRADAIDF